MKKWLILVLTLLLGSALFITEVHAKRFGGGKSFGKQYSGFSRSKSSQSSANSNTSPQGAAAANAGRSSGMGRWLGPLAGLAAGGLLASLFFGDAFEGLQIMDMLLFAGLIFGGMMLFKAMRAKSAQRTAGAGPFGAAPPVYGQAQNPVDAGEPVVRDADTGEAPAWFDAAGFADGAKTHFIRLQAAWDKGDFRDIREYTTPEMFAELQREYEKLGGSGHHTEVMMLEAELLGTRREADQLVASVHFTGMIREEQNAGGSDLSEIWHVVHDWDQAQGDWLIAGIQQTS